ncbi:SAM-dependent methyltransferase [Caproiciproducens sp. NJN-50]|uniref:tRNA (adenine(22)-N(1))-methyltransferase n=1 Tax=Acutalibacteraceae TaxID=3082771 RepID=UPI000FFE0F22|nr:MULTISPECIES: class I SAM-dependent methyltransferase [Acutalibacteraceae]QAT49516.1 SAM-dependent methyltransferase [Caproiciproducens sp. NJN-50]
MNTSHPASKNKRPSDRSFAGRPSGVSRRACALFSLGDRLSLCASMVRAGTALADVGTDHAYLPVWLAKRGMIRSAVAADVRPGPLARARANIDRFGVSNLVSARLSDGLDRIEPSEAEDLVIAGMGGLMMVRILERAPWLKETGRRLILQPMTKAEELRGFLVRQGFLIEREQAAEEDGHVYSVMQVSFCPQGRQEEELFYYIGRMTADTVQGRKYLEIQKRRLEKRANGLLRSGNARDAGRFYFLVSEIEKLLSSRPA